LICKDSHFFYENRISFEQVPVIASWLLSVVEINEAIQRYFFWIASALHASQ